MARREAYVAYLALSLSFLFYLESLDFRKRNSVDPSLLHKLHTLPYKLHVSPFWRQRDRAIAACNLKHPGGQFGRWLVLARFMSSLFWIARRWKERWDRGGDEDGDQLPAFLCQIQSVDEWRSYSYGR
ncbi:hypothetical protein B9Z19DRAFT_46981 [Tuber borchii]|uniref:Uncharacterized protein n=1 Tax=Tuber borchii TaxID=42251 RepID=A0A2T7A6U9_TUBBO|nr:hypothetical protein B9Z19DRAFT_46981 [Tuber borchii]